MILVWVDTGYACGGLEVESFKGKITDAPPIWRKWIGKKYRQFIDGHYPSPKRRIVSK